VIINMPKKQGSYSTNEVSKHNKEGDMWITIHGDVYNVTSWTNRHPGGKLVFQGCAGSDASVPYESFHDQSVSSRYLHLYKIGTLSDFQETELTRDYEVLRKKLYSEGLYETDYTYYYKLLTWLCFLFAVSVYLISSKETMKILFGSVVLGLFWQQTAFVGHDCGHNAITHVRLTDWWIGIFVTLFFGVSGQWWKRSHNTHHIFPNSIEWDPDIQHLPFLAIDKKILNGIYSYYHQKKFNFDAVARLFVRIQHILFFPIMAVARWFMYVQSWALMFNFETLVHFRFWETCSLIGYWIWLGFLLSTVPTWSLRVATLVISHACVGVLHCQITFNHFAMPTYSGVGYNESSEGHFIKVQLSTTCDVGCDPWFDWFHGGLQFQTIHHLFPRLPRHNLRYVKHKYMLPFCKKHGLNYITTPGFFATTMVVINKLYSQAMLVASGKHINFKDSLLSEFVSETINA